MVFSSLVFLFVFLGTVLGVYYLLKPLPLIFRNCWLFLASIFFYAYGEPVYVVLMLVSILVNYCLALLVDRYRETKSAKFFLVLTIVYNIGILFVFKYWGYTSELLSSLCSRFGLTLPTAEIALPIGISFYTFQSISYVVDVKRGRGHVQKNPLYVGLYISLFPQLIAGPIVRYSTIDAEICGRNESVAKFTEGVERFLVGLNKKVLIANNLAAAADKAFGLVYENTAITCAFAWLGAISYSLQIFFDFSGYSDMAIGLGKMFGFDFEENFNFPYMSQSFSEFWRRWHISLGTWFRDYVYIPLGGSRTSRARLVFNLFVVWTLTGIWHGAHLRFALWGLMYFVLLTFEKLTDIPNRFTNKAAKLVYRLITLVGIVTGWAIFRADSLGTVYRFVKTMFLPSGGGTKGLTVFYLKQYFVFYLAGLLLCTPLIKKMDGKLSQNAVYSILKPILLFALTVMSITYLVVDAYNPFIYFNF